MQIEQMLEAFIPTLASSQLEPFYNEFISLTYLTTPTRVDRVAMTALGHQRCFTFDVTDRWLVGAAYEQHPPYSIVCLGLRAFNVEHEALA